MSFTSDQKAKLDLAALAVLTLIWFACIVWRNDALPIIVWDEARNVANADSLLATGQWLVPQFDGAPDRWNTKPPLLIWCIAALMQAGVPVVPAARLPSMVAVLLTAGALWAVCRVALNDRAAAFLSVLLLFASQLYMGAHVGRTGDYDAMLVFFTVCAVLSFWLSVEGGGPVQIGWLAACSLALVLGVLTKGVAAAFVPVGLALFALLNGSLRKLMVDWRAWLVGTATAGLCVGYYLSRETYDPGYFQSVWENELGGRFTSVIENHAKPPGFYLLLLAQRFQPGLLLLPLVALPILYGGGRRRSLALATVVTAAAILAIISAARTKLFWYAAPVVPLLALAAGLGAADALRWLATRREPWAMRLALSGLLGACALGIAVTMVRNHYSVVSQAEQADHGQFWYGRLMDDLAAQPAAPGAAVPGAAVRGMVVLDTGLTRFGAAANYNPTLDVYARQSTARGHPVTVLRSADQVAAGVLTATCDPAVRAQLKDARSFTVSYQSRWCVAGYGTGQHWWSPRD